MKIFSLIQTKYYQLETAIKSHLSKTLSSFGTSYNNNTVFGQLINVLNAVVQNMMLYIEDSMVEQNKYTAQRKKSIYGLAAVSGYTPFLGKAAGVQLSIDYIPYNIENFNIIINNHEKITCTKNGLVYNIILPQEAIILSIEKDNSTKYLYAVQGKFETQTFISKGGKYYTQNLNFIGNLDVDYITVKINNKKWERRVSLYDMNPNGEEWTYKISPVGGIDIIFGNDMHGKSLKPDDVIEITYLIHDGELGNLNVNERTNFVFNNTLKDISGQDVDGNQILNIKFGTQDNVTSGTNSESIEQTRQMIGFNSRSLVLADVNNYKEFLSKFSFCGYNRTWSEKGSFTINSLVIKNYKQYLNDQKTYFDLTENDFKLSNEQKQSLIESLDASGKQLAGISYNIFDPEICKYAMYLYIKPKSNNIDKDYINNKIRNLIGDFFSSLKSDIFIPKSDIIQVLKNNIKEIDSVDVYILSEQNETAMQVGYYIKTNYNYDPTLNIYKKTKEKVYLYDNENPFVGLDEHGNIYLHSDEQFPVLMGGWDYINNVGDQVSITDPLIIVYQYD